MLRRAETARRATQPGQLQQQQQQQVPTAGQAEVHVRASVVWGIDSLRDRIDAAFRQQQEQHQGGGEVQSDSAASDEGATGIDLASLAASARALCGAAREDQESRTYCRASGLLRSLCRAVGSSQGGASGEGEATELAATLFRLLAALCGDAKNAEAVRSHGGFGAAVSVVAAAAAAAAAGEDTAEQVAAAVAVVEVRAHTVEPAGARAAGVPMGGGAPCSQRHSAHNTLPPPLWPPHSLSRRTGHGTMRRQECSTEPACRKELRKTGGGVPGVIALLRNSHSETVERCANIVRNLSVNGATVRACFCARG